MTLPAVPILHPVMVMLDLGPTAEEVAIGPGILILVIGEVGPIVRMKLIVGKPMRPDTSSREPCRATIRIVAGAIPRVRPPAAVPPISLLLHG